MTEKSHRGGGGADRRRSALRVDAVLGLSDLLSREPGASGLHRSRRGASRGGTGLSIPRRSSPPGSRSGPESSGVGREVACADGRSAPAALLPTAAH